jgi:Mn2+/Fe2+ NRAMP family transporter
MKQRFLNILFWSVLAAAFIGPGTVTTAASAGAEFGYAIVWALTFSIIACVVLQEASARLTIATGQNLGESIRNHFGHRPLGRLVTFLIVGSIILGCAAYETGNILGAVAGVSLVSDASPVVFTLVSGLAAGLLLWFGSTRLVAQVLGFVVAFMGLCFVTTAILIGPSLWELIQGGVVPRFPGGSELLILALIGTTVVPSNIFLGSGLSHEQSIKEMRFSLGTAIVLGGLISLSVLIVGTALAGSFTFEALADQLVVQLGDWAVYLLGFGLYAAGFSSAITASLAAAITAKSLAADGRDHPGWQPDGAKYRAVWGAVLAIGVGFGVAQVQPIPAIILAQALNGVILPIIAVYLLLMVNNAQELSPQMINSTSYNVLMGLVVFITIILGFTNLVKALSRIVSEALIDTQVILAVSVGLALLLAWPIARQLRGLRQPSDMAPSVLDAK